MKRIAVVGAGGFGREVRWLISDINSETRRYEFIGFIVSDLTKLGPEDSVEDVLGDYDWLQDNHDAVDCLTLGIGSPASRLKVARELSGRFPDIEWPALIHPNVKYDKQSCSFGDGVLLCAGTIVTVNVTIGAYAMANLACTIGHEAALGEGVVLNPTVNISGGVKAGEGVLVGTGAQILQYVTIGEWAVVGAGAVVAKDVEPSTTVVGVPAKPLQRRG